MNFGSIIVNITSLILTSGVSMLIKQKKIAHKPIEERIELISKAIRNRIQIEFEYLKEGKVEGKRLGNPHSLYLDPNTRNLNCHIYQVEGVSETAKELPIWRTFSLEHVKKIELLENTYFETATGYNPFSKSYVKVIERI